MNNQVVFNKFAVKSGDNWVADSDLLKRTAGYKVTAEDWNSIFHKGTCGFCIFSVGHAYRALGKHQQSDIKSADS